MLKTNALKQLKECKALSNKKAAEQQMKEITVKKSRNITENDK